MSSIYLPGRGMVNLTARKIDKAVREYDHLLYFRRHPQNNQWTIFRKMEHGADPHPVLGFGYDLPTVEFVRRRLYETDSRRHDIVRRVNENNARIKREQAQKVAEGEAIAAEALEWGRRKMRGEKGRIVVPKGVKS